MTNFFTNSRSNAVTVLFALIKHLNARITLTTVQEQLITHPDYPSLLSMNEVLTEWNVDNTALQLNSVEQLREMPFPLIAQLRIYNGWYVLVTKIERDLITYFDSRRGEIEEPLNEFEKQWEGVVLLAEADEQSGEPDYAINRRKETLKKLREPFIITSAIALLVLTILNVITVFSVWDWLICVTKVVGLALSCLLVTKQLGHQSVIANRFCKINDKINCDSILDSPGAKLWGWLSWSDVGLLYFASGLLTVLMMGYSPNTDPNLIRPLVYGLALLALPYIIFSVYYQFRVVRHWCILCLAVQSILLVEGLLAISQLRFLPNSWQPFVIVLTSFLSTSLLWVLVKPLFINAIVKQREYNELLRLKRDPDFFGALLKLQPQMPAIPTDLRPILMGNSDAEHAIVVVTNPYCSPCAKIHRDLEQLLEKNKNIQVKYIFTCDGVEGPITEVAVHMMALAKHDKATIAISSWYNQSEKHYKTWSNYHPADLTKSDLMTMAENHRQWCHLAGVSSTPTLYINGYRLPAIFQLNELRLGHYNKLKLVTNNI